jgi:hypothetical protein
MGYFDIPGLAEIIEILTIFVFYKMYYYTKFQGFQLIGANVGSILEIRRRMKFKLSFAKLTKITGWAATGI